MQLTPRLRWFIIYGIMMFLFGIANIGMYLLRPAYVDERLGVTFLLIGAGSILIAVLRARNYAKHPELFAQDLEYTTRQDERFLRVQDKACALTLICTIWFCFFLSLNLAPVLDLLFGITDPLQIQAATSVLHIFVFGEAGLLVLSVIYYYYFGTI